MHVYLTAKLTADAATQSGLKIMRTTKWLHFGLSHCSNGVDSCRVPQFPCGQCLGARSRFVGFGKRMGSPSLKIIGLHESGIEWCITGEFMYLSMWASLP